MLQKGDTAPLDVAVHNHKGETISLRDLLGQWVVLYFYPKDDTPGCTTEAKGFRDYAKEFAKHNTAVIGVSKDTPGKHQKFIDKYELNFDLWADEEHALMDACGVWGEKQFMGRTYMGTSRSSFLIDPDGKIAAVWEKVKPAEHPAEVLATRTELSA